MKVSMRITRQPCQKIDKGPECATLAFLMSALGFKTKVEISSSAPLFTCALFQLLPVKIPRFTSD